MIIQQLLLVLNIANIASSIDLWCGKAYKVEDAAFDPGGWLHPPPKSEVPLLNLQAYPRKSIYLADEHEASIIIDSEINLEVGVPFCPLRLSSEMSPIWQIDIISADDSNNTEARAYLTVNSTGNEIPLSIVGLKPKFKPYELDITITHAECSRSHIAKTQIYRIPLPNDGGGVTRVDYLHGGLEVREDTTGSWRKVFPFGFYADWGGYLRYPTNQDDYAASGYNVVSPVPGGAHVPFDPIPFAQYVEKLDERTPSFMYNMRWGYKNGTLVRRQVEQWKTHKGLLLWYTADEPGGQGDPLDAPLKAYDVIKALDPYHPISLVLNCANFHYAEYTRGAEIILTDPYPIAVNTTHSSRWNTLCNTTYGCCGCDNCRGNFRDISTRLDNFKQFQRWLSNAPLGIPSLDPGRGAGGPKVFWGVPQVFGGSEYWTRPPTEDEEAVMVWLFINHGAKGIVGWLFPTVRELEGMMSRMARVVTSEEVTALLLGDKPRPLDVEVEGGADVDAAAWVVGHRMLLSIVYLGLEDTEALATVKLPYSVKSDNVRQLWPPVDHLNLDRGEAVIGEIMFKFQGERSGWEGDRARSSWRLNGSEARRLGLPAMSVSILIADLEP